MSGYELFEQGPEVYIPVLLISLLVTVTVYCAFPLIYAIAKQTPVTKKKYRILCYSINAAAMVFFAVMNGEANIFPYILWTGIFSACGNKILDRRQVLSDGDYLEEDGNRVTQCPSCNFMDKTSFDICPRCGKQTRQYVYLKEKQPEETKKVCYCRECGTELLENCQYCRMCGVKVKW